MRILHLASEYPPQKVYGLGRYVCDLSRELAAQGHEVHVLTNSIGGADQDVTDRGVRLHRIDHPMPPKPAGTIAPVLVFNLCLQRRSQALGLAELGDPEVIVSHDYLTAPAGHRIAHRWGLPHIWTVHDCIDGKRFGKVKTPDDLAVREIERWAARAADAVLVNSSALKREIATGLGAQAKTEILPGGVDPARFTGFQSDANLAAFRGCLAAPDEILLTYVGRLDQEKGIDTLINAFAKALRAHGKMKLAIAGRGDLQPLIENHIRQLQLENSVRLLGYLQGEVLKSVYRVSDIHLCPSRYEPFGLVALEAMAAGAPIIAGDTGGLADIVEDGKSGLRFRPEDVGALANSILSLAHDKTLRRRLAEGAQNRAEKFAWPRIAKQAATLYEKFRN